jgi:hypothetical protein
MVKLNQNSYLGYMTIPIIMKKLYEGEGRGPSRYLLAHMPEISWSSCGNYGNFLKISGNFLNFYGIFPSLDRKRFPPWANEK